MRLNCIAANRRRSGVAPPYVPGQTIADLANTIVTAAPEGGFTITKSGGVNAAWDAGAASANLSGNSRVRVRHGSGVYRAGLAVNPAGAVNDATGANGMYSLSRSSTGSVAMLNRFNNQVASLGAASAYPYAWIEYDAAGDVMRVYRGVNGDFAAAELIYTSGALALGSSWGFDSVLSSAGATFDAHFDGF